MYNKEFKYSVFLQLKQNERMRNLVLIILTMAMLGCSSGKKRVPYYFYLQHNPEKEEVREYAECLLKPKCEGKYTSEELVDSCMMAELKTLLLHLSYENKRPGLEVRQTKNYK